MEKTSSFASCCATICAPIARALTTCRLVYNYSRDPGMMNPGNGITDRSPGSGSLKSFEKEILKSAIIMQSYVCTTVAHKYASKNKFPPLVSHKYAYYDGHCSSYAYLCVTEGASKILLGQQARQDCLTVPCDFYSTVSSTDPC